MTDAEVRSLAQKLASEMADESFGGWVWEARVAHCERYLRLAMTTRPTRHAETAVTDREAFRARVVDLLRRSGTDDAETLVAGLDRFVLPQDLADAIAFALAEAAPPQAVQPIHVQITVSTASGVRVAVGRLVNGLHGLSFHTLRIWGADI